MQVQAKAIRESITAAEKLFPAIESIIWKESETNLLKLFKVLHSNEIMPSYTRVEVLTHFMNVKLKPFRMSEEQYRVLFGKTVTAALQYL